MLKLSAAYDKAVQQEMAMDADKLLVHNVGKIDAKKRIEDVRAAPGERTLRRAAPRRTPLRALHAGTKPSAHRKSALRARSRLRAALSRCAIGP